MVSMTERPREHSMADLMGFSTDSWLELQLEKRLDEWMVQRKAFELVSYLGSRMVDSTESRKDCWLEHRLVRLMALCLVLM